MNVKRSNVHYRLSPWQIAALEQLVERELGREAEAGATPWVTGLQGLRSMLAGSHAVTVSKVRQP